MDQPEEGTKIRRRGLFAVHQVWARCIASSAAFISAAFVYAIRPTADAFVIAVVLAIAGCSIA